MKPETKQKKKRETAQKLAKAALIAKPVSPPAKGYTYLKDVAVGELVDTGSEMRAVVLEHTSCASVVLVLNADNHPSEDKQFYLGKHRWANQTEVKVIGD